MIEETLKQWLMTRRGFKRFSKFSTGILITRRDEPNYIQVEVFYRKGFVRLWFGNGLVDVYLADPDLFIKLEELILP